VVGKKSLRFGFQFSSAKTVVFGSVSFFSEINCGFVFFQFGSLHSFVNAICHLCSYGMMLEMTYFRTELAQLLVSQSISELEVQRNSKKKNTSSI